MAGNWPRTLAGVLGVTIALVTSAQAGSPASDTQAPAVDYRHQGVPHSSLYGIGMDGLNGVAVGTFGSILVTEDGGKTWLPQPAPTEEFALIDAAIAGENALAVGQMGVILKRDGEAWRQIESEVKGRMLTVDINAGGQAIIGAEFGTILYSDDAGESWRSVRPPWQDFDDPALVATAEPHVYGVHVAEDGQLTVAGEFGVILQSADQGQTWSIRRKTQAAEPTLFALHLSTDAGTPSFAVGQRGAILRSLDAGQSWETLDAGTDANLLGVSVARNGLVVVTAMRAMLISRDAGASWRNVDNEDVRANWYLDTTPGHTDGSVLAAGHSSRIIEVRL